MSRKCNVTVCHRNVGGKGGLLLLILLISRTILNDYQHNPVDNTLERLNFVSCHVHHKQCIVPTHTAQMMNPKGTAAKPPQIAAQSSHVSRS